MSPMSPRLLRPRARGGFDPRTIANLAAWYDAADTANVTLNGSNVSQLTDKSGNGRNATQGTAGSQPAYSTAKYNGKNVVTHVSTKSLSCSVPLTAATSIFLVATKSSNINSFIAHSGNLSIGPSFISGYNGDYEYYTPNGTDRTVMASAGAASGLNVLAMTQSDASNLRVYYNGGQVASKTPALAFSGNSFIALGGSSYAGDIAELLVFNRVVSTTERQQIEGYLAWKWGLQAQLPYNHPYAASFPGYGSQTMPTDSDALTYLAAVATADGGTGVEVGVANAVDAFVKGCKSDGIWSAIKASCILSGARTLSGALTPLVGGAPTNNNFVAGDYSRRLGPLGDGSTKTISTGRSNNADGQNDNHIYTYCSQNYQTNQFGVLLGASWSGGSGRSVIYINNNLSYFDSNSTSSYQRNAAGDYINIVGGWGVARSQSDRIKVLYKSAFEDVAQNSVTPTSNVVRAYGGYVATFNGRLSFYSVGSFVDLQALNSRVAALHTAIGAAIP